MTSLKALALLIVVGLSVLITYLAFAIMFVLLIVWGIQSAEDNGIGFWSVAAIVAGLMGVLTLIADLFKR